MLAITSDTLVPVLGSLLAALIAVVVGVPAIRAKNAQATASAALTTIEIQKAEIEVRDTVIARLEREKHEDAERYRAQEARCNERIDNVRREAAAELAAHKESNAAELGKMTGRLEALTDTFADTVAEKVHARLNGGHRGT